jgi:hypothetical protein
MTRFQRLVIAFSFIAVPTLAAAGAPTDVVNGCQGEGCGCYAAYIEASQAGKPTDFPIPTVRPFDLFERLDRRATPVGQYPAGTLARPLEEMSIVVDRGDYVVRTLAKRHPRVRVGDHVNTLFSEGEGDIIVLHKGTWVPFANGDVELRVVRRSVLEPWMRVSVGGREGFARGVPFKGCRE